jgi:hypothetical protein
MATMGLAFLIALLAKDLTLPLMIVSLFGLFDRLAGQTVLRGFTR